MPIEMNGAPSLATASAMAIGALRMTSTLPAAICWMAWEEVRANWRSRSRPSSSKKPQDTPAQSAMKLRTIGNGIITVSCGVRSPPPLAASPPPPVSSSSPQAARRPRRADGEAWWPGRP